MSRLILQGKEGNEITIVKGTDVDINVDLIGDRGEYIDVTTASSFKLKFYTTNSRAGTAVSDQTVTTGRVLSVTAAGSLWTDTTINTTYYVFADATISGDVYISTTSSTITIK